MLRGYLYRLIMRIAHKFNWHYAPPVYPDGDTQLWCKWCGFRQTTKTKNENYSPGWVKLVLMVSPEGKYRIIDGDRVEGDERSEKPYIGMERLKKAKAI